MMVDILMFCFVAQLLGWQVFGSCVRFGSYLRFIYYNLLALLLIPGSLFLACLREHVPFGRLCLYKYTAGLQLVLIFSREPVP